MSHKSSKLYVGMDVHKGSIDLAVAEEGGEVRLVILSHGREGEGDAQNEAYAGLGLRPEEYCVMVLIAEYQLKLVKTARHAA